MIGIESVATDEGMGQVVIADVVRKAPDPIEAEMPTVLQQQKMDILLEIIAIEEIAEEVIHQPREIDTNPEIQPET